MHDHLNMSKVSGILVPRMLPHLQKKYRFEFYIEFLTLCDTDSIDNINRIVTGDEI